MKDINILTIKKALWYLILSQNISKNLRAKITFASAPYALNLLMNGKVPDDLYKRVVKSLNSSLKDLRSPDITQMKKFVIKNSA